MSGVALPSLASIQVVIGLETNPLEQWFAANWGAEAPIFLPKEGHDALQAGELARCAGKSVAVMGSYLSPQGLADVQRAASALVHISYDSKRDAEKYVSVPRYEACTMPAAMLRDCAYPSGTVPGKLFRDILSTTLDGVSHTPAYRALRTLAATSCSATGALYAYVRSRGNDLDRDETYAELAKQGVFICAVYAFQASVCAKEHGVIGTAGGQSAFIVLSPSEPVGPYRDAAKAQAALNGCQLAITVRLLPKVGATSMSIVPALPGASTDFVLNASLYNGGGPAEARGTTIPAIVATPFSGCNLDALVEAAVAKRSS
jgi:hypothetical protein